MEKFIAKKRRSIDGGQLEVAKDTIDSCGADEKKRIKTRKICLYCYSYLNIGFSWCGDEVEPSKNCLICNAKLCNEAMVLSKLKRHFENKHDHLSSKPRIYFERMLNERKQQSQALTKNFTVSSKAQKASYRVAELITKNSKPHTEAESLILPACCAIVKTMFGSEYEKEIKKIPLSNNTICRRICDMSANIEDTMML